MEVPRSHEGGSALSCRPFPMEERPKIERDEEEAPAADLKTQDDVRMSSRLVGPTSLAEALLSKNRSKWIACRRGDYVFGKKWYVKSYTTTQC